MHWTDITDNLDFLLTGFTVTVEIALVAIIGSLILGIILGILRYSKIFPFNLISTVFIESTRSIPLILFIVFVHFAFLPLILGINASFFQSASVGLIFFTSAYVAEIVRGGLNSVEISYIEASKSLGLNYFQRMAYVVLPIALRRMIPALIGQFITLIKDTSLASTIGLIELTRSGEIIYERTYHEFEILIFIALVYFGVCFSLSRFGKKFELGQLSLECKN